VNAMDNYLLQRGIAQNKNWIRLQNGNPEPPVVATLPTYIRNSIHHPENTANSVFTPQELKSSIEQMINLFPVP